jgi:hypothetical protein
MPEAISLELKMGTRMRKIFVSCYLVFASLSVPAQSYNPYVNQGKVTPAPMLPVEFNGEGILSFNVGNSGSNPLPLVANQEMTLAITLSYGIPGNADPLAALAGT